MRSQTVGRALLKYYLKLEVDILRSYLTLVTPKTKL